MKFLPVKHRRALIALLLLCGASLGFGSWAYRATEASKTYTASFVGRESCAKCHAGETHRWTGSHHDLAMDLATPDTVVDLAAFDGREFKYFDVTSKFFREGDKFFVTTDGDDGKLTTFEIKYVFGVDPLQQYMVEFPDKKQVRTPEGHDIELPGGRVQVLSIAWDTHRGEWFHLYPKRQIAAGDWLHWTGGGQNWNYMCADCHSTDLQKNYDAAANVYHTTWKEIDVSCEACHGPASEHVARAEALLGFNDPRHFHSYALHRLKDPSNKPQIETCAQCHSHRRVVHGDYRPGRKYYDYFDPMKLDGEEYYADGQIKAELYEYGSFLQSRMYRENVRCSDCHDPHSLQPKFAANALCTQCHTVAKYDSQTHHHHAIGSTGSQCADCHMPRRTYMEVDPRRDHSIRVPRPDLTKRFLDAGMSDPPPNACQTCHDKEAKENPKLALSLDRAVATVAEWFPDSEYRKRPHFGETLEAGRRGDPHAAAALADLARDKPTTTSNERFAAAGPIVRAGAAALLGNYGDPVARQAVDRALKDPEPLVRLGALQGLRSLPADAIREYRAKFIEGLRDPIRAVRTEAVNRLLEVPRAEMSPEERELFWRAFAELEAGVLFLADSSDANASLAGMYVRLLVSCGSTSDTVAFDSEESWKAKADAAYRRALAIDPVNVRAMIEYAAYLDKVFRDTEAEQWLRCALDALPRFTADSPEAQKKQSSALVRHELGWLLLRDPKGERVAEAAEHLKAALDAGHADPEALQHYGVALLGLERFAEAEEVLSRYCRTSADGAPQLLTFARRAARNGQLPQAQCLMRVVLGVRPELRQDGQIGAFLREIGLE